MYIRTVRYTIGITGNGEGRERALGLCANALLFCSAKVGGGRSNFLARAHNFCHWETSGGSLVGVDESGSNGGDLLRPSLPFPVWT